MIYQSVESLNVLTLANKSTVPHTVWTYKQVGLSEFQQSWNHNSLSTEGSRSAYQLFVEGLSVEEREDDHPTSDELEAVVVPHNTWQKYIV